MDSTPTAAASSTTSEDNKVTLGFVVGSDYANPGCARSRKCSAGRRTRTSAGLLEGGKRIGYGARAITAAACCSLPKRVFPGGAWWAATRLL
jgi:electron-transferring-flavoprotein dehydrogenase